ncbi:glycoside hydrolase family 25 protein [Corynebacterium diphtheriae]|uniref:glycoside hydrolase family 25 protein n=1 Tax=Corynebacterium diphtheriae TaxID=1717 RepID=UPI000D75011F|nr:glycoside hydrolase family 25 protein [Corynebacterium diphtheriae]
MRGVKKKSHLLSGITGGTVAVLTSAMLAIAPAHALPLSIPIGASSGIDVSGHQHPGGIAIDWKSVQRDGQSFAFVKASEGEGWSNDYFTQDAKQAANSGLKVGSYHYARPSKDARTQARHYAAQVAQINDHSLPPVLDIEVAEGKTPEQLAAWTKTFLNEFESQSGRKPMIYTYRYFWTHDMANTKQFAEYPLWLAAYQTQAPEPVGGWDTIDFWQRSGSGRIGGIVGDVDLNLFNGDDAQLDAFASGNYASAGGKFASISLPGIADLGGDSQALVSAVAALAAGAAAAPQVAQAAENAGLSTEGAEELIKVVQDLINSGNLPVDQLKDLAAGNYSVGDLVILLDNAQHLAATSSEPQNQNINIDQLVALAKNFI